MNIYEAINKVMAQIGAIGKNSKNQTQGFMYRGIDAIMNGINPALIANKVFVVPTVLEQTREERTNSKGTLLIYSICKVKFTFYAEDGSFVEATTIGEGMDTGDKATNKAMSIAFKYACFQVFCIPTEEMAEDNFKFKDPDAESHEVKPKASTKQDPVEFHLPDGKNITPQQKTNILSEITRVSTEFPDKFNREFFLESYKVSSVDELLEKDYEQIMSQFAKYKKE